MSAFAIDTIAEDFRDLWGDKRRQSRLTVIVLIVLILYGVAMLAATVPSHHGG